MRIYQFNRQTADVIQMHESHNIAFKRVAKEIQDASIGVMYIAAGGVVGYHPTVGDQLFLVLEGSGWVTGADRQRTRIDAGEAAFWRDGEWHESGSETGLTAVLVEAPAIKPGFFLEEA